jgi:6-phospho-beta-glucosidase
MYYGHNPKFPDNFMWGASSAAWQVEGGVADGGRTPAIIDLNSKTKKPFTDNTYAADHYHHYKEDVALMAECGFSSYRFSLSWSRIIPHADGKVNPEGIAFYNDLINELVAHNITPIVPCITTTCRSGWMSWAAGKAATPWKDSSTTAASALRTSATGSNTGCR